MASAESAHICVTLSECISSTSADEREEEREREKREKEREGGRREGGRREGGRREGGRREGEVLKSYTYVLHARSHSNWKQTSCIGRT